MSEITHWDMTDSLDLESFVDNQVYQALQDFGASMTMLIGTGPSDTWEDRLFVHLADERQPVDGVTPAGSIGKAFSLREEILQSFNDVPDHNENEADDMIKMANHLEDIAQTLRARVAQVPPV